MIDETTQRKVEFINNCIKGLKEEDYILIVGLYLEKCGINTLKSNLFLSKAGIYKRKDRIIRQIAMLFERVDFGVPK